MSNVTATFPPLQAGCGIQLRVFCTYRSQLSVQTFYYNVVSIVGAGPTMNDLATAFLFGVTANMPACITTGAIAYGVGIKAMQTLGTPEVWSNPVYVGGGVGTPGTGGTTPMDTQSCGLASFTTASPGKAGRGRTYMPFLDQTMITSASGLTTVAYQANVTAFLASIGCGAGPIGLTTGGFAPTYNLQQCIHRYGTGPMTFADVIALKIAKGVATQRRRGTTFGRLNQLPF